MIHLKQFRIDVYNDDGREMVSIQAQLEPEKKEPPKDRPWSTPVTGLGYISFYATRKEFTDLINGDIGSLQDGYHRLDVCGEVWTFYNFDLTAMHKVNGVLEVPYQRAEIPRLWAKGVLLRACNLLWAHQAIKHDGTRTPIVFPPTYCARVIRKWGQGKGKVAAIVSDWKGEASIARLREASLASESMRSMLERLMAIAGNSTYACLDVAKVHISLESGEDRNSFYWSVERPDGSRSLCGGLINHSRDGGHDWSLHT